ncbi:unnamed protein product [Caenorhabditis auriculariae]|uniref:Coiled-coil domain-containing protein 102A n=1 Tax=Caenorhabditis auriculariae TaxID=2777116 RepID=A0A8S1GMG7_9PELO|nr:unnamed protein product [Caenorhabditis auriculariae]
MECCARVAGCQGVSAAGQSPIPQGPINSDDTKLASFQPHLSVAFSKPRRRANHSSVILPSSTLFFAAALVHTDYRTLLPVCTASWSAKPGALHLLLRLGERLSAFWLLDPMADSAASIYNRYYEENNDSDGHFLRTVRVRRCRHTDWDLCESIRLIELQEARDRASQMEKTMRWWSNCTAEWRARWSAVRDERNRARNEAETMKQNYEVVLEEKRRLDEQLLLRNSHPRIPTIVLDENGNPEREDSSVKNVRGVLKLHVGVQADCPNCDQPSSLALVAPEDSSSGTSNFEEECCSLQNEVHNARVINSQLKAENEFLLEKVEQMENALIGAQEQEKVLQQVLQKLAETEEKLRASRSHTDSDQDPSFDGM